MAEEQRTAADGARKPTEAEWLEAERAVALTLRSRFPGLGDRADEVARDALMEAYPTWRRESSLVTFATTIAMRRAAKLADREVRAKAPPRARARTDAKRGEVVALAPVFRDFFQQMRLLFGDAMVGGCDPRLGEDLRMQLGSYMAFLLSHYEVPASLRPTFVFAADFDAKVNAYAEKVFSHGGRGWLESEELLDVPLQGVTGKPRRDPYRSDDPDLAPVLAEQKNRHTGLRFAEKREQAVEAVVRYAIGQAGFSRTLLNEVLGRLRVEEKRDRDAERRAAFATLAEFRAKSVV